jgi:RNA polymerase sigma-70 factor (ECF subfamily)
MPAYPEEGIVTAVYEPVNVYRVNPSEYFISIYNEFYPYAFFLAKSFVSPEDAIDIVATVFSKLWLKKNNLEKIENLKGYIAAAIRNACRDHLRNESDRKKEEKNYFGHLAAVSQNEYFREEAHAEKLQRIYSEMEILPSRCREIFKLAYLRNLKNAEIARLLGISNNTVRNQKSHALKTLRMTLLTLLFLTLLRVFP